MSTIGLSEGPQEKGQSTAASVAKGSIQEKWGLKVADSNVKQTQWEGSIATKLKADEKSGGIIPRMKEMFRDLNHPLFPVESEHFFKFLSEFQAVKGELEAINPKLDFDSMQPAECLMFILNEKGIDIPNSIYLAIAVKFKDSGYSDQSVEVISSGLKTYVLFVRNEIARGSFGQVSFAEGREVLWRDILSEASEVEKTDLLALKRVFNSEEDEQIGADVHREIFRRLGADMVDGISQPPIASDGRRIVMKLHEGEEFFTLAIEQQILDVAESVRGMKTALDGLDKMVTVGALYTDFKLENLLVRRDRSGSDIIDFGGSGILPLEAVTTPDPNSTQSTSERLQQMRGEIKRFLPRWLVGSSQYLPDNSEMHEINADMKLLKSGRVGLEQVINLIPDDDNGDRLSMRINVNKITCEELINLAHKQGIPEETIKAMEEAELAQLIEKSQSLQANYVQTLVFTIGMTLISSIFAGMYYDMGRQGVAFVDHEMIKEAFNGWPENYVQMLVGMTQIDPSQRIFYDEYRTIFTEFAAQF